MSEAVEIQYLRDVLGIRGFVMPTDLLVVPPPADLTIYFDGKQVLLQSAAELSDLEKSLVKRMLTAIQVTDFSYAEAIFVPLDSMPRVEVRGLHEMANNGEHAAELKKKVWGDLQNFSIAMKSGPTE